IVTILCLSEGMHAVREIRANFAEKTILVGVRIVKAGSTIAEMAFDAGADGVTGLRNATDDTVDDVLKKAHDYGGEGQIELCNGWGYQLIHSFREKGIEQFIYHRSTEVTNQPAQSWNDEELKIVENLTKMGCK